MKTAEQRLAETIKNGATMEQIQNQMDQAEKDGHSSIIIFKHVSQDIISELLNNGYYLSSVKDPFGNGPTGLRFSWR